MSLLPPILLIDDSADDRELVSLVLTGALGAVEIEEVADAASLARAVVRGRFGVVVTEHALSWIRSGDVVRLVRDLMPGCPVVVFSRESAERVAGEILHLAPDGILPKTSSGWVGLPRVLRQVVAANPPAHRRAAAAEARAAEGRAAVSSEAPAADPGAAGERGKELEEIGYAISHDLAQPLTQIRKFLDLLEHDSAGRLDAESHGWLEQARSSAARLEGMADAVLRCARIESRGQGFASVDLGAVLARVLARLDDTRPLSGAEITADPLPTLVADEEQIEQLLQNLISNALKFRGEGAPRVHVGAADEGEHWHLWVRDNGIGIASKDFQRIFVIFQRLHTESEYEGSGIGLAICRRIVARHGGRIWVESRPGQGATFHLTLEKVPAAAAVREG